MFSTHHHYHHFLVDIVEATDLNEAEWTVDTELIECLDSICSVLVMRR